MAANSPIVRFKQQDWHQTAGLCSSNKNIYINKPDCALETAGLVSNSTIVWFKWQYKLQTARLCSSNSKNGGKCMKWLIEKKVPSAEIDGILKEEDSEAGGYDLGTLPHYDQDTWLINCDRTSAENQLHGRKDGTFLIRPKREEGDVYVLSIMYLGSVGHCKVLHKKSGYGFAEPFFKHASLMQLVIHYQQESLKDHNPNLDIRLLYPVKAHEVTYTREPVYLHMNTSNQY